MTRQSPVHKEHEHKFGVTLSVDLQQYEVLTTVAKEEGITLDRLIEQIAAEWVNDFSVLRSV